MGCDCDNSWYEGGGGGTHQLHNMKMASYLFNEFNRFLRLVICFNMMHNIVDTGCSIYDCIQ